MRKYKIMKRKEVLFTPEEWETVVKRANSVSMKPASFIRRIAVNGSVNIYNYPELSALLNGMRIIGNNINQLAKKANEINSIYAADYEMMKEEYAAICLTLNQYVSTLPSGSA